MTAQQTSTRRYRVTSDKLGNGPNHNDGTLEELQAFCREMGWSDVELREAHSDTVLLDEDGDIVAQLLRTYHVAEMVESTGGWDIRETFEATGDYEALCYAEENYAQTEWYVLDEHRRNVLA